MGKEERRATHFYFSLKIIAFTCLTEFEISQNQENILLVNISLFVMRRCQNRFLIRVLFFGRLIPLHHIFPVFAQLAGSARWRCIYHFLSAINPKNDAVYLNEAALSLGDIRDSSAKITRDCAFSHPTIMACRSVAHKNILPQKPWIVYRLL